MTSPLPKGNFSPNLHAFLGRILPLVFGNLREPATTKDLSDGYYAHIGGIAAHAYRLHRATLTLAILCYDRGGYTKLCSQLSHFPALTLVTLSCPNTGYTLLQARAFE